MDGCLPKGVEFSWAVGDARHKKPYPRGKLRQMTPAWKRRVRERMHQLELTDAELGRRVKSDKAGIGKILDTDQTSSKFVDAICAELDIDAPFVERITEDALNEFVASLKDPNDRRKALELLRLALGD
jgi:hypothetical protein